ncbi:MAG: hypothetical protein RLZZ584_949 [Pseudomonadota bacterium]|jgi:hypothetical protein
MTVRSSGPPAAGSLWRRTLRLTLRPLRFGLGLLLALVILFEEWGWGPLQRAMAWIGRLPVLRQIEAWIARLPPYGALALFLLPSTALLPVKLAALWLIGHGHAGLGLGVIVAAKLAGTAVLARLFSLTQPALMQLTWFARLHRRWIAFKDGLLARVRASAPWRAARAGIAATRAAARRLVLRLRRRSTAADQDR